MKPIKFEQANFDWAAPKGEEKNVDSMPAYKGVESGTNWPLSISCWELTKEDLDRINNGGKVWLRIYGEGHPALSLSTENPWG